MPGLLAPGSIGLPATMQGGRGEENEALLRDRRIGRECIRWGDGFANAIFTGLQRLSGIKFTLEFRYEMVV